MSASIDNLVLQQSIAAKAEAQSFCNMIPEGHEMDCPERLVVLIGIAAGIPFSVENECLEGKIILKITLTKPVAVKLTRKGAQVFRSA